MCYIKPITGEQHGLHLFKNPPQGQIFLEVCLWITLIGCLTYGSTLLFKQEYTQYKKAWSGGFNSNIYFSWNSSKTNYGKRNADRMAKTKPSVGRTLAAES